MEEKINYQFNFNTCCFLKYYYVLCFDNILNEKSKQTLDNFRIRILFIILYVIHFNVF